MRVPPFSQNLSNNNNNRVSQEDFLSFKISIYGSGPVYSYCPEKCDKLIESLEKLNQNQVSKVNWTIDRSFRKKDFVVQRTGASASALSVKRLEHEINLQALNNDKKKWELKVVQRTLLRQKLEKQLVIKGLKYEEAKIELEVLKKQFSDNT